MSARPRKSVVQNIIKNLLEMEIPEIQTASKELAEWIKQLEQHSFKLQHYATEIENWASEEEEVDSIELTDLIKDLEATLSDMRQARSTLISGPEPVEQVEKSPDKMLRAYGRSGRVLREQKVMPKSEFKVIEEKTPIRQVEGPRTSEEEVDKELPRTSHGILIARETEKPRVKPELPTGGKETVSRETIKPRDTDEVTPSGYLTPEGFLIRRLRP